MENVAVTGLVAADIVAGHGIAARPHSRDVNIIAGAEAVVGGDEVAGPGHRAANSIAGGMVITTPLALARPAVPVTSVPM